MSGYRIRHGALLIDALSRLVGIKLPDNREFFFSSSVKDTGYDTDSLSASRNSTADDNGTILVYSGSAAITYTIVADMPAGFGVVIRQAGTGQVTIAAGAGVTVTNASSYTKTAAQNALFGAQMSGPETYSLLGQGA